MKIAIINEPWNGGATRCAKDLAAGLRDRHDVWLCPDGEAPRAGDVLGLLDQFNPDVVHLHAFYGWLGYETLARIARRYPTVYTPHDPRPIGQIQSACYDCERNATCFRCPLVSTFTRYTIFRHRYFLQRLKRRFVHNRTPQSLQVVGVSRWFVERMRRREMSRFNLRHIPNGIDPVMFSRVSDAKQRLGLPADSEIILFLSTPGARWQINEMKGMLPLSEAFIDRIAGMFPRAILAIAGDVLVPNHPQVRGLGFVPREQLPLWYSAASVYVHPSSGDNLPYTVLEAMGCECPVVASTIGGIPEMVEDGVSGILIRDRSPAAIADALASVLRDANRAREMGRAGRRKLLESYTLERFIRAYEELYLGMTGRESMAAPADSRLPAELAH